MFEICHTFKQAYNVLWQHNHSFEFSEVVFHVFFSKNYVINAVFCPLTSYTTAEQWWLYAGLARNYNPEAWISDITKAVESVIKF